MNEDECCLICLDETLHVNCILECCNKKVHSSCIKQWWNIQNMEMSDAGCPHCRQKAKLKKITPEKKSRILPINYPHQTVYTFPNQSLNPAFGIEENIRPDSNIDLTDDDILEINSNNNNFIHRNNFRHNSFESEDLNESNFFNILRYFALFTVIILILFLIYFWLSTPQPN